MLTQPPGKSKPPHIEDDLPTISATDANKSQRYLNFLWRWYHQGIKDNPRVSRREYDDAFRTIAGVYSQLSVTWEGTATPESVKGKPGFPAEDMVKINFPVPAFLEKDGKLMPIHINHNEWSKKIRPNTKITAKAFIEDIRVTESGFVVVLSHVTLVSRRP